MLEQNNSNARGAFIAEIEQYSSNPHYLNQVILAEGSIFQVAPSCVKTRRIFYV